MLTDSAWRPQGWTRSNFVSGFSLTAGRMPSSALSTIEATFMSSVVMDTLLAGSACTPLAAPAEAGPGLPPISGQVSAAPVGSSDCLVLAGCDQLGLGAHRPAGV